MNRSTKFLLASISPVALAAGWAVLDSSPAYSSVRQAASITENQGNAKGFFLSNYRVTRETVSFLPLLIQSKEEAVLEPPANASPRNDMTYAWLVFVDIGPTGAVGLSRSLQTTRGGTWTAIGATSNGKLSVGVDAA